MQIIEINHKTYNYKT